MKPTERIIKPYFPEEIEVVKKIPPGGDPVYHHPAGGEIRVYPMPFSDVLHTLFARLEALTYLSANSVEEISFVYEAVTRDGHRIVEEALNAIGETVGHIILVNIGVNQTLYRAHRIVDAELLPAQGGEVEHG